MTSDDHPTLGELAELAEGALAAERVVAVRAHLAGCEHCQDQTAALTAAAEALHSLGPVSMPPQVVARIDAALAAQAAAPAGSAAEPSSGPDVVPNLAGIRSRRGWLPTAPTAAAATIVVLAVIAIVIGVLHKSPSKPDVSSASGSTTSLPPLVGQAPAGSTATTFPVEVTGRSYTLANLDTLAPKLAADRANPSVAAPAPTETAGAGATGGSADGAASGGNSTGTAPQPSGTAHSSLQRQTAKSTAGAGGTTSNGASTFSAANSVPAALLPYSGNSAHAREAILTCAAFVSTTTNAVPEAVDLGRWTNPAANLKNAPALIMLFAGPPRSDYNVVYVVGPRCGDNDVYKYETVPISK